MGEHEGTQPALEVKRWRRFGHDRLYANAPDGTRVGWVDLLTGERTLEVEEARGAFEQALADHPDLPASEVEPTDEKGEPAAAAARQSAPQAGSAAAEEATAAAEAVSTDPEPWAIRVDHSDLAVRQAGQAAREQAVAHREAAPVKTLLARALRVHTDERAWRVGAKGEERVAARLDRLPDGWQVLHAVPVGTRGADIDHLAIGPGGVFTINAKHHPDARVWVGGNTFMVNGHRQPYIRNSRHEAQRAARLLSAAVGFDVPVTGVIAVVGAHKGLTIKAQPDDVHVTARKQLAKWLGRQEAVLDSGQVAAIYAAARKSTTWR